MLLRWLLNTIIILALPYIVPGVSVASFWSAVLVALVLGILNALVKPILIILTLPVTVLSLGLFIFVLNTILVWLTSTIVKGFEVSGFGSAFLAALFIWIGSMISTTITKNMQRS